ncbi:MAG: hypothetical protein AABX66_00590 [Nanoarchaeota archaeon]
MKKKDEDLGLLDTYSYLKFGGKTFECLKCGASIDRKVFESKEGLCLSCFDGLEFEE